MIEFRDVSFAYAIEAGSAPALESVTLTFEAGTRTAVVGANGSGKSTLAKLCDGLLVPSSGTVTVDGLETSDTRSNWEVRSVVGMVFQNPDNQIVGTLVEEDVAFGPENLGLPRDEIRARVDEALEAVGLAGFQRREPHLLSEGQKQRLAVAGALAMRPRYLVLDEPTSMLDGPGRADVRAILAGLADSGHGVVHVTHRLEEVAEADTVIALAEGRVAYDGAPDGLLGDVDLLDAIGVARSPAAVMAAELRRHGVPLAPCEMSAAGMVEALWA